MTNEPLALLSFNYDRCLLAQLGEEAVPTEVETDTVCFYGLRVEILQTLITTTDQYRLVSTTENI
jgi:hypothetical protein